MKCLTAGFITDLVGKVPNNFSGQKMYEPLSIYSGTQKALAARPAGLPDGIFSNQFGKILGGLATEDVELVCGH
jgi:hypothetical protein